MEDVEQFNPAPGCGSRGRAAGVIRNLPGARIGSGTGLEAASLRDLIDREELQSMLDAFARLTEVAIAIQDIRGRVLVAANWQGICTDFHRRHPQSRANCLASDTRMSRGTLCGNYTCYQCRNGLRDVATPIIVADRHVGNIFLGQFLLEDDVVDGERFRRQAVRFGFDEQAYLASLARVPRCSRATLDSLMKFLSTLSKTVSSLGYSRIKLSRALVERDHVARDLFLSQERLQLACRAAEIGVWDWDIPADRLVWDARMSELYGLPGTGSGRTRDAWACRLHPEDRPRVLAALQDALAGEGDYAQTYRVERPDGSMVYVQTAAVINRGPDREPVRMIGTSIDVTQRALADLATARQAEVIQVLLKLHETAASATSAQDFLDRSLEPVLEMSGSRILFFGLLDETGARVEILAWSRNLKDDCGLPAGSRHMAIEGAGLWAECIRRRGPVVINDYGESRPGSRGLPAGHPPIRRLLGVPIRVEERIVAICVAANKDLPYEARDVSVLQAVANKIWAITERKRTEESLVRLAKAVGQAAVDIVITDPEGTIRFVNPSVLRTLGYAEAELLGQNPRIFRSGRHDQAFYQSLWATLNQGQVWTGQLQNRAKDGRIVLQDGVIAPIRDRHGHTTGFVATRRDVTREVEMEAHFVQAEKMEAIGTLAGGIAHDFNNILMGIQGFAEIGMERCGEPGVRDCLGQIQSASVRAAELVKQILTFSRGTQEEVKPIQPGPVVLEAMKLVRATVPATIEIRTGIACPSMVMANPDEIHRVVVNLCANAALAMKPAGGLLGVTLDEVDLDAAARARHPHLAAGRFVRLVVKDTGCGMTDEVRSHIFEPFFSTRRNGEGTGLGLSVVHGIIAGRGGVISVASAPGEGSTFTVLLPARAGVGERRPKSVTVPAPGTERILFVDDEAILADLTQLALRQLGYAVTACTSGAEALAAFEAEPGAFDVVVSDMTMPGMTGDILAGRIRKIRPGVPIILCTGFSERMNEEKAKSLGVSSFVLKPVTPATLSILIRRAVDRERSA